jgi:hypothetical protein
MELKHAAVIVQAFTELPPKPWIAAPFEPGAAVRPQSLIRAVELFIERFALLEGRTDEAQS